MAPVVSQDSLVLFTGDGNISCVYTKDGSLKWQSTLEYAGIGLRRFVFDDNLLFGHIGNGVLYALNLTDGSEAWEIEVPDYDYFGWEMTINSDYYFVSLKTTSIYQCLICKYDKTGVLLDSLLSTHMPRILTIQDNRLYANSGWSASPDDVGRITCYDAISLDSLWGYNSIGGNFSLCRPVFENGILYAGTVWGGHRGNEVVALNATTGELIWRTPSYGVYQVIVEGDYLYCDLGGGVLALNKSDGTQLWETLLPVADENSVLAYCEGYLYNAVSGGLYVFDAITGEIVFKTLPPDNAPVYQVAAGAGKVFVQSSRHLYAYIPYH